MVTDQALQGITIIKQGKILYANSAFCQMTGYQPDELLQLSIKQYLSLIHPDDLENVSTLHQEHIDGMWGTHSYQFRFKHKGGNLCWLQAHDVPLEYKGSNTILTAYLDITQRISLETWVERKRKALPVSS